MTQLKHLFQPITVGTMQMENRVVMPGMTIGFGVDEDRCATPQLTAYLVERARSRPGMITLASTLVHPLALGEAGPRRIALWDDRAWPGLEDLIRRVHEHGVRMGIQLAQMPGRLASEGTSGGSERLPPANLADKYLSREEINQLVESHGRVARRCVEAGFDFLEINAAFEYVLSGFLTPFHNDRTDEYGGRFENRIGFLLEVVRRIRSEVGDAVPVGVKMNGDDYLPERGWTMIDACRLAPILEREGVDCLHIAAGILGSYRWFIPSMYEPQGAYVHLSALVKAHTSLPVMAVVRIKDPVMADRIVAEGKADLVAMGRAHIADPEIVDKARRGDLADIRPCLGDCRGCIDPFYRSEDAEATCTVNPRMGREYLLVDIEGEKANAPKRVLVAGAGPAGLEAARRAAFSGHSVTLCDARPSIGGQLRLAAAMPGRSEIGEIIPWYERQLNKLGVRICLNTPVDEGLLDELRPDVLVLATGSLPEASLGFISGLENVGDIELVMADEVLEERRPIGDVVLIVGGDQIGLQLADHLLERGKSVYLVERSARFAEKMAIMDRFHLNARVKQKGVKRFKNVRGVEIADLDQVWMTSDRGRVHLHAVETVVLAAHRRPSVFLAEVAQRRGIETHIVGDATGVEGEDMGTVMTAIATGYDVGRQI